MFAIMLLVTSPKSTGVVLEIFKANNNFRVFFLKEKEIAL